MLCLLFCRTEEAKQKGGVSEKENREKDSGELQEGRLLSTYRVHQNIYMKQSVEKIREKAVKHTMNKRTLPQTASPH